MEAAQLISEEWDSLSGQYTAEEADFMAQFLSGNGNTSFGMPSYFPSNVANANFMCFSNGSSISTSTDNSANTFSTTTSSDLETNIDSLLFCLGDAKLSPQYFDDTLSKQINYESIDDSLVLAADMENTAKRFRSSIEDSKNMRNVRKCPNSASVNNNEDVLMWHGSNKCFSHVDSNASIELNRGTSPSQSPKEPKAPNLYRKSKATSGLATDAQSIYARRRRERINERLRILQTLVPNGTKVDISTMLEEAVQYVKFLQLQIKLLSSEDMWMYAPIAYNGINIGLDLSFN